MGLCTDGTGALANTDSLLQNWVHLLIKQKKKRWDNCIILYELHHEKNCFCICENKGADQLCGNCRADCCLRFRYIDSTIPLIPKSKILSLLPSYVFEQPGLCQTWSETLKTGLLMTQLICIGLHADKDLMTIWGEVLNIFPLKHILRLPIRIATIVSSYCFNFTQKR